MNGYWHAESHLLSVELLQSTWHFIGIWGDRLQRWIFQDEVSSLIDDSSVWLWIVFDFELYIASNKFGSLFKLKLDQKIIDHVYSGLRMLLYPPLQIIT